MLINGEWIEAEDWLIPKLNEIRKIYDEIKEKIEEGEFTELEARNAMRYIHDIQWVNKSPEDYWQSSSYTC
jgi:hypothetical protein